jgi:NAD(P)-dependent dehydrogenase (short-subunit alcohol dehydrogenase family)
MVAARIVNNASNTADVRVPGFSIYSGTKGGIIALSRDGAIEYAKLGIRINIVSPSAIETDMLINNVSSELRAEFVPMYPIGRLGKPEDVAEVVVWLCSDAYGFICRGT